MPTKVYLDERELPKEWYNFAADLPSAMLPPLGPDGSPVKPEQLSAIFPAPIIEQEVSRERWIPIPDEVRELLYAWRPTPLHRAHALERALGTRSRIYYKNESVSPAGSHKPNTAIAQAYYNKISGVKHLVTETGAGQWGSALAFSGAKLGLSVKVYMVKSSFEQKPFRKHMMRVWGAECVASPSRTTAAGRAVLARDPDCPGSLGVAISEAVEEAVSDPSGATKYALGSVLNHVMLHQTVIGQEAIVQLGKFGERMPDVVVACVGGGSNFAGLAFPFAARAVAGEEIAIVPVEPAACPTLTKGPFVYDFGDIAKMTPLLPMHSLGHEFMPPSLHAGGLRYHGMAPLVSQGVVEGLFTPKAIAQLECFEAATTFARSEGIIPAPESSHAIAQAIREARQADEAGEEKVILFGLSGHGLMDLNGYACYYAGELDDYELPPEVIERSLRTIGAHPRAEAVASGRTYAKA